MFYLKEQAVFGQAVFGQASEISLVIRHKIFYFDLEYSSKTCKLIFISKVLDHFNIYLEFK